MSTLHELNVQMNGVLTREALDPVATMELMPQREGIFCGARDVLYALRELGGHGFQVWTLDEGAQLVPQQVAMRVRGHFLEYSAAVNGILGLLATQSGWATAARAIVEQAGSLPMMLTAPNLILPQVLAQFEYAAHVGGIEIDSPLARGLLARSHLVLRGDALRALRVWNESLAPEIPRLALVGTFHEPVDEAVRIALGLGEHLTGVVVEAESAHAETFSETLHELREQLDLAGFPRVKIFVCGDVTPERIALWQPRGVPCDGFFVGDTIAAAAPLPFRAELKESDGKPLARRGLVPGTTPSPRLKRIEVD